MPNTAASSYRVRARNLAPDADNKIHDDEVAQQFGFSGALVPGVDLFAYATHPLVAAWGEGFLERGRLTLRFRKPVYDGENVSVAAAPAGGDGSAHDVTLAGPDGVVRATGTAWPQHDGVGELDRFRSHAAPMTLLPTGPEPLPVGPLGSIEEPVEAGPHSDYLHGIDEQLPLYRDGVVHPGAVLRFVNLVLMRNVDLGPWIHTASDCRFLGVALLPGQLQADAVITDVFERNGNQWVRYDALVRCDGEPVALVDHQAIYRLAD